MKISDIFIMTFESMRNRVPRILINIVVLTILLVAMTFTLSSGSMGMAELNEVYTSSIHERGVILRANFDIVNYDKVRTYMCENVDEYPIHQYFSSEIFTFDVAVNMFVEEIKIETVTPNVGMPEITDGSAFDNENIGGIWITQNFYDSANSTEYFSLAIGDKVEVRYHTDKSTILNVMGITSQDENIISNNTVSDLGLVPRSSVYLEYNPPKFDTIREHEKHMENLFKGAKATGGDLEYANGFSDPNDEVKSLTTISVISIIIAIILAVLTCLVVSNSIALSLRENSKFFGLLSVVGVRDWAIVVMVTIEVLMIFAISISLASVIIVSVMAPFLEFAYIVLIGNVAKWGVYTLSFKLPIVVTSVIATGIVAATVIMTSVHMAFHINKGVLEVIGDE